MDTSLILVVGLTGAGKTTYCDKNYNKFKGHVFSIDRWMKSLYWQDMPANPDINWFKENHQWYVERIARCEALIQNQVSELLKLGTTCILDLGFTAVAHRETYINLGSSLSVNVEIHHLNVDKKERWRRVEERNNNKSSTFSMLVDKGMFDYMEDVFENFSENEKEILIDISN